MNTQTIFDTAAAQHRKDIAVARTALTVAAASGNPIAQIAAELAALSAGLQALEAAQEDAAVAEALKASAALKASGLKRAVQVVAQVHARRASYDALQASSDAFLTALKAHVSTGEALRNEASNVATAVFGAGAGNHMVTAADAAAGTTGIDALALAGVLRSAVEIFGVRRLDRFIGCDSFAQAASFDEAFDANVAVIASLTA